MDSFIKKLANPEGGSIDPDLLTLAEAFVDSCMSFSETSKKMKIHRNTVTTKLDKLKELTGLDPATNIADAFFIKMAAIRQKLDSRPINLAAVHRDE